LAGAPVGGSIADLGCGTGDFSVEAAGAVGPQGEVVGVDLSEGMLSVAREKIARLGLKQARVVKGNAQETGLPSGRSDAVTAGWVIRNVGDRPATYREVLRLLKPGGRFVILDCSRPANPLVRLGFAIYLRLFMPLVIRLRGGDPAAYRYLADSTARFLTAAELSQELRTAGFVEVAARGYLLGTIALHVAVKPGPR
jgi:demethylmenaquinone methyltransferase/2-methoxy-6-polyprenyl-1,4-benzoquinol methylase